MKVKEMKNKKAISLIVLVITILVLAILATTVILSISNTDIVNESKLTVFKSDMTTYNDMYDMYVIEKIMNDITFDESSLTLTYKDSEYDNIFGNVPDKYKEGLKVINGKLVYETSDEREKEIIEELGLVADKIKIVTRLTNCTSSSSVTGVEYGTSFNTTITANAGYTLQKVAVVMNGVDVTSSVYTQSSGKINISSVTGKVIITATTDINTYAVTQNLTKVSTTNNASTAKHGTSFTTTLVASIGHTLNSNVTVTMGGSDITSTAYNSMTNEVTVSYVTGDVIISASANAKVYTITNNLTNVTSSNSNLSTTYGSSYTAVLTPSTDYEIKEVTVTVGGTDVTNSAYNATTKTITLNSVVGDIVVYAVAESAPIGTETTADGKSAYIGCYVDKDGDGIVDSVIFADLAHEASGTWNPTGDTSTWATTTGAWSYDEKSDLKVYVKTGETYEGKFGTNPVLEVVEGSTGSDRFYVMALSNFVDSSSCSVFFWYYGAYSKISPSKTSKSFGTGVTNTATMIDLWNAGTYTQNEGYLPDVWGVIQDEVAKGWFLPSIAELAAFASAFDITSSNYSSSYGLYESNLSSSLYSTWQAYYTGFDNDLVAYSNGLRARCCVRLAATF